MGQFPTKFFRQAIALAPALLLLAASAPAQAPKGNGQLAGLLAENSRQLRQYTYKQRTEVSFKGEDRMTRENQVKFGPDGQRQLTLISETGGDKATGLGSRIVNKKREEMKDYVMRLSALVESYFPPDPEKMKAAANTAELAPGPDGMGIKLRNVEVNGDAMTLVLNTATRKMQKLELNTKLDKDNVAVTVDMATLPNGTLNYPATTHIKVPSKSLDIHITTYDYMKL